MQPESSGSHFESGVDLRPCAKTPPSRFRADHVGEASRPAFSLVGWFLPQQGEKIHGIRAVMKRGVFTARRKQLRTDVMRRHPQREDALHSGFKIAVDLRPGWNEIALEYKTADKTWKRFSSCLVRLPYSWRFAHFFRRHSPENAYEQWFAAHAEVTAAQRARQRELSLQMSSPPLISLLVPVYNTPAKWLKRLLESVHEQTYPKWELCFADDHSTANHVQQILRQACSGDPRVKAVFRTENGHICQASNSALEICTGEFTALLDHDDELPPDALFEVASFLAKNPETDLVFSDEDKIDENGTLSDPYFKGGWNYDLFHHQNCFSHLGVFRTSLLREIGGFRLGMEGSQDWDLVFRLLSRVPEKRIRHIPRVLYHWRTLETSTSSSLAAKPYAMNAGRKAVSDHLASTQPGAETVVAEGAEWRVAWPLPSPAPRVSIIIPSRDRVDLLSVALESLFQQTDYPDYEIIVVDHESAEDATHEYFKSLCATHKNVHIVRAEGPFNWSRLNNLGARSASGRILLFLNNDVEITQSDWLREMVSQASRPQVGAVGALLLYPDGTIQHAGVVLGMTGIAGHVFRRGRPGATSISGNPNMVREVTAVTGACLAVTRRVFEESGGFDEERLPVNYNDVDFCLRLRSLGYRNIFTPFARLTHHESVSRAALEKQSARKAAATEEARVVLGRWPQEFIQDEFFNPNLDRNEEWPAFETSAHSTQGTSSEATT